MTPIHNSKPPDSGRQAPSEKHLEDYLWEHPEALGMVGVPPQYGDDFPVYRFALRQFRLPSGIVDLVGFDYRLCAFELKKGTLTARALTQLLRYMRDLKWTVDQILFDCSESDFARPWLDQYWHPEYAWASRLVGGVLIGHDIEDDNLLVACAAVGVDVYVYDFINGRYEFDDVNVPTICHGSDYDAVCCLAEGQLGDAFIGHYREDMVKAYSEAIQKHNSQFNAAKAANEYVNEIDDLDGVS